MIYHRAVTTMNRATHQLYSQSLQRFPHHHYHQHVYHKWLSQPASFKPLWKTLQSVTTTRIRWFSASSSSSSSTTNTSSSIDGNEVEKFVKYALNRRAMPLGTMKENDWQDTWVAVEYWFQVASASNDDDNDRNNNVRGKRGGSGGGGFAVDSAERLIQRLVHEKATMHPKSLVYQQYKEQIIMAQGTLLCAWLEVSQKNPSSTMALERSEKSFLNCLKNCQIQSTIKAGMNFETSADDGGADFPIHEFISLVKGWLHLESSNVGIYHASSLLLEYTMMKTLWYSMTTMLSKKLLLA